MITTFNQAAATAAAIPLVEEPTSDADRGRPAQVSMPGAAHLNLVADESPEPDSAAVADPVAVATPDAVADPNAVVDPVAVAAADPVAVAAASGVGARITLAVMADDYVRLITEALAATDGAGLLLDTDRVSTFVRGSEQRIAEYLRDLIAAASASGHHLVAHLLLSRGCPGEVCGAVPLPAVDGVRLDASGVQVQAQWSLYPLAEAGGPGPADGSDHLAPVWAAIDRARQDDTFLRAEHFVTTLVGDLSDVLGTAFRTWLAAGVAVPHVVTHLTISVHSPSEHLR